MTLWCLTSNSKTQLYADSDSQCMGLCGVAVLPDPADCSVVMSARGMSSPQTLNLRKIKRPPYISIPKMGIGIKEEKAPVLSSFPFLRERKVHCTLPNLPFPLQWQFITHFPIHWCKDLMVSRYKSQPSLLVCNTKLRTRTAHHLSNNLFTPILFLLQFHWLSGIYLLNMEASHRVTVQVLALKVSFF